MFVFLTNFKCLGFIYAINGMALIYICFCAGVFLCIAELVNMYLYDVSFIQNSGKLGILYDCTYTVVCLCSQLKLAGATKVDL